METDVRMFLSSSTNAIFDMGRFPFAARVIIACFFHDYVHVLTATINPKLRITCPVRPKV